MIAAALTDKGLVRNQNQDTVFCSTEPVGVLPDLYMVADGMGGHKAGDYCSRMLVERILAEVRGAEGGAPLRVLRNAIKAANRSLFDESLQYDALSGMGSTLTAAVSDGSSLSVFNVGDSRLYVLDAEDMVPRQVTRDHSYVEEMVQAGRMKRGSEIYNRNKNIITRAIGIGDRVEIDAFEVDLLPETVVLLCTDGLSNMLTDAEIGRILRAHTDPNETVEALIDAANAHGGTDNISAIVVMPSGKEAGV